VITITSNFTCSHAKGIFPSEVNYIIANTVRARAIRMRMQLTRWTHEGQQQRVRAGHRRRAPHEPGRRRHVHDQCASARPVPAPARAHVLARCRSQIPAYASYFPNASYSLVAQLTYPLNHSAPANETSYIVVAQPSIPITIDPNVS
jgi:hypothetical protein